MLTVAFDLGSLVATAYDKELLLIFMPLEDRLDAKKDMTWYNGVRTA